MSAPSGPERVLLVGLLLDALEAVLRAGESKVAERRAHDARVWMAADDPAWPFSFVVVCRELAVDGEALRAALPPPDEVPGARREQPPRLPGPRSQPPIR